MGSDRSRQVRDDGTSSGGVLTKARKATWSYTSLSQIAERCALQYYFQRIEKLEPEFTAQALVYGSSIHAAASWVWRLRKERQAVRSVEIQDVFAGNLEKMVKEAGRVQFEKDEDLDSLIQQGRGLVDLLVRSQRDDETIIDVDLDFEVPLRNTHGEVLKKPLVGELDVVLAKGTGLQVTIRDLKTGKRRYDTSKIENDLQATCYSYGFAQKYPSEGAVVFEWQLLLKNKKPDVVEYETIRGQDDFDRLFQLAQTADRLLKSGAFLPNRTAYYCSGCAFRGACDKWHRHP